MKFSLTKGLLVGLASLGMGAAAHAEWPEEPVTLMVPFSPGGGVDQLVLPLVPYLEESLGQSVLMDYKPGASGQVGYQILQTQGEDGHLIAALVLPHLVGTLIYQNARYEIDDFAPVAIISGDVPIWFTHKDAPYDDMHDLIEAARERPGEISLAIGSFTGEHYITVALVEEEAGVSFRSVAVGGGSDVMSNVVGRHFDVGVSRPSSILGVRDDIKGLGIVAPERHELYPEAPTFAEQFDDLEVPNLQFAVGVVTNSAFRENDPEGFARLVAAVEEAVHSEDYRAKLAQAGRTLNYLDPEGSRELVQEMMDVMKRYQGLVEEAQGKGQ